MLVVCMRNLQRVAHLDVAVYEQMLSACQLIPEDVKLRAHTHPPPSPIDASRTTDGLPCIHYRAHDAYNTAENLGWVLPQL